MHGKLVSILFGKTSGILVLLVLLLSLPEAALARWANRAQIFDGVSHLVHAVLHLGSGPKVADPVPLRSDEDSPAVDLHLLKSSNSPTPPPDAPQTPVRAVANPPSVTIVLPPTPSKAEPPQVAHSGGASVAQLDSNGAYPPAPPAPPADTDPYRLAGVRPARPVVGQLMPLQRPYVGQRVAIVPQQVWRGSAGSPGYPRQRRFGESIPAPQPPYGQNQNRYAQSDRLYPAGPAEGPRRFGGQGAGYRAHGPMMPTRTPSPYVGGYRRADRPARFDQYRRDSGAVTSWDRR